MTSGIIPESAWPEYADAVWREFTRRSGKAERLMSCMEWDVIHGWLEDGIPLRVVLRAMADTKGMPRSLSYYHSSVQQAHEYQRQAVPL